MSSEEGNNMEAIEAIMTRRSTRQFSDTPVEVEKLEKIIECGRYAPSGVNLQQTKFLVIQSRSILDELTALVQTEFAKLTVGPETSNVLAHSIKLAKQGKYVFHYNPPVFIVTANKIDADNNIADCVCAIENMMLAANALGLGSCYINQIRRLNENPAVNAYMQALGLEENERVFASMSLGYADTSDGLPARNPLPRTGNHVRYL